MNVYFDLDGTLFDLYNVENWLEDLRAYNSKPYLNAKPMLNFSRLARFLNRIQRAGHTINVVSWSSKETDDEFHRQVAWAKYKALRRHLPSVHWDNLVIAKYGEPKSYFCTGEHNILFDDDIKVRIDWNRKPGCTAFNPDEDTIISFLKVFC